MVLGLTANLSQPTGTVRWVLHGGLIASAIGVLALLAPPLVRQACSCARDRRVAVEWLFLAGILGAFGASLWSTFTGRGAVYYEVVAVLVTIYATGKALTAAARERAFTETRRLRDLFAQARRRDTDGQLVMVATAAVEIGDRVVVFPGEAVPVDGIVIRGAAWVRETPLTGEPMPVVRREGDTVMAGSFSEDGELEVCASSTGRARRLDGVLATVEQARGSLDRTSAQSEADRIAAWFLPAVLGVAAATFIGWAWAGRPGEALFNALSVLLVACPCALGLATPLALWHALAGLAARGIVVRSAAALERAARVTDVCWDKTGTLSEPGPELVDFVCSGDAPERSRLLDWTAAVQSRSPHPLSQAFRRTELDSGVEVLGFKIVPACGVEAWLRTPEGSEHRVQIGRREWIGPDYIMPPWAATLRSSAGDALVAVAVDGRWVAWGAVRESMRPDAAAVIAELHDLGCRVSVLSGDRGDRVREFTNPLGVDASIGDLSSDAKAGAVEKLRQSGRVVAMVGDGVNDATALRAADVGVAVGGGAPLAEAVADVVLAGADLGGVPLLIRSAREVRGAIRSSLGFAAFYNVLGMALAAAGLLHPVVAALLMVGSSAVVSWRALRPMADPCGPRGTAARPSNWVGIWMAATLLVQVPLVGWLGRLSGPAWIACGLVLTLGAAISIWPRSQRWAVARVSLAMLGPGNLLMLVGWWADAGFGPVMRNGVCLCCQSHHYFELGARIPWMYVGMLAGGLPSMWPGLRGLARGLGRWTLLALAATGMVGGMGWGAEWVLRALGPGHPQQFPVALAGMSAGMLCGMFFACALGEAVVAALRAFRR